MNSRHEKGAVFWDLDGTLIDSSGYHCAAWHETLIQEGIQFSEEELREQMGFSNILTVKHFFGEDIREGEIRRIGSLKEKKYRKLLHNRGIQLMDGAQRLLEQLGENGWIQAITSSAPIENIQTVLDVLAIDHHFAAVIGEEDVLHTKPEPDVFFKAAACLNTAFELCVIVEDTKSGIIAAKKAGMKVIGVSATTKLDADIVFGSLQSIGINVFSALLDR